MPLGRLLVQGGRRRLLGVMFAVVLVVVVVVLVVSTLRGDGWLWARLSAGFEHGVRTVARVRRLWADTHADQQGQRRYDAEPR